MNAAASVGSNGSGNLGVTAVLLAVLELVAVQRRTR